MAKSTVVKKSSSPGVSDIVATFSWGVRYAAIVHNGATLKNGTVIPARPWTTVALETFDVAKAFETLVAQGLPVETAFKQVAIALGGRFQETMTEEIFDWPNPTNRKDGTVAGTKRNIVDRGMLRASQSVTFS
jgi:hypothetical protein